VGAPKRRRDSEDAYSPGKTKVVEEIASELLRIHRGSYGRGAGRATAHLIDDAVVLFLDDLELLPNEQFLIESGKGEAVLDMRSHYEQAIESTFRAAVERATGRRVVAFSSTTHLGPPNFSCEVFRLEPRR
jgi:uncharacterized protein YbcI